MLRLVLATLVLTGTAALPAAAQDPMPNVNYPTSIARSASLPTPQAVITRPGQASATRSRDGHFYVTAKINGGTTTMMVDTGATGIALTQQDAIRAGLNPDTMVFSTPSSTANGMAYSARAVLRTLTIGGITRTDVPVTVARPGALFASLLGQTFLSQLTNFQVRGDTMVMAVQ